MFGISFSEILIVMVVSLLLFGPDKLPEAAKSLGRFMAMVKRNSDALRREFYNTVYEPAEDLKRRIDLSARELVSIEELTPEEMNCEQKSRLNQSAEQIEAENRPAETTNSDPGQTPLAEKENGERES